MNWYRAKCINNDDVGTNYREVFSWQHDLGIAISHFKTSGDISYGTYQYIGYQRGFEIGYQHGFEIGHQRRFEIDRLRRFEMW